MTMPLPSAKRQSSVFRTWPLLSCNWASKSVAATFPFVVERGRRVLAGALAEADPLPGCLADRGELDGGGSLAAGRKALVASGKVLAGDGGDAHVRGPGHGTHSLGGGTCRADDAGHHADRRADPFHACRRAAVGARALGAETGR